MTTNITDLSKAKSLVRYLIKHGYALTIDNGGGIEFPLTTDVAFVCSELAATGHDSLHCSKDGKTDQVYLVYNDEPDTLIADYSTSLEPIIEDFEIEFVNQLVKSWLQMYHKHADYILSDANALARWCADYEDNELIEIPTRDSVIHVPVTLTK
jgi:hypothetical protein